MLNSGDTAWMLISTALVILMTIPGVAMFYSGLTKRENVLNTIFLSFVSFGVVSLLWFFIWLWPHLWRRHFRDNGNSDQQYKPYSPYSASEYAPTIPGGLFAIFQMTFAAITVALISGAVVERIRFSSWIICIPLWFTFVYVPVAHWVWGGGFLQSLGVYDFAGGIVVHLTSGIAALALALVIGPRHDQKLMPHHLGYSVIGTGLLWFGWFGFNAGSALSAGTLATDAMIVTNTSAAAGMLGWMLMDRIKTGKPTLLGALSGAVAGTVTYVIAILLKRWRGLRVERNDEIQGLDINLHEETGYRLT